MYLSTKIRTALTVLVATSSLAAASLVPAASAKPVAPGPPAGSAFTSKQDWLDTCDSLRRLYHYDQDHKNTGYASQDYATGKQAGCDMSSW